MQALQAGVHVALCPAPPWRSSNARWSPHERAAYMRQVHAMATPWIRKAVAHRPDLPYDRPVRVEVVWRQPKVSPLRDPDGIASWAGKALLDAAVELGVIPDDDHRHVWSVTYRVEVDPSAPTDELDLTITPVVT